MRGEASRAGPPLLSLFRNRPPARGSHQGWRRNRRSARVSWPSSVLCSAELTAQKENWPLEIVQPSAVLGEPLPLCARRQFSIWSNANQWRRNIWATWRSQRSRLRYLPAGIYLSCGRKQRRRRNRAQRYVDCGALPMFPGGRRRTGRTNRRPHVKSEKSPQLRSAPCYFPAGVDPAR